MFSPTGRFPTCAARRVRGRPSERSVITTLVKVSSFHSREGCRTLPGLGTITGFKMNMSGVSNRLTGGCKMGTLGTPKRGSGTITRLAMTVVLSLLERMVPLRGSVRGNL